MNIFYNIDDIHVETFSAVTVGSFDGIHLGHQQIVKVLNAQSAECNCTEVLVTFHPHPKEVLNPSPDTRIELLTPLDEKIQILQRIGLPLIAVIPFTREFSRLGYREFVKNLLIEKLKMKKMVIGYDHAFGRNREGHADQLRELGQTMSFSVSVIPPYYQDKEAISSSRIRSLLKEGQIETANHLLGRPYSMAGKVEKGENRGKKLGFPTANIQLNSPNKLIPRHGVYAVDILLENTRYSGMMNIGHRPTFNFDPLTLEVHIFNFSGLIYGVPLEVFLKKFIREERKFDSPEALKNQIREDKQRCLEI